MSPPTSFPASSGGAWRTRRLRAQANWRQFKRDFRVFSQSRLSLLGVILIVIFAIAAMVHPLLLATVWPEQTYDPTTGFDYDLLHPSPPSTTHVLGTDTVGRDILSVLLASTTSAFIVGLTAAVMTALTGMAIGVASAYFRGAVDSALTQVSSVFLLIPPPIAMIIIGARFHDMGPAMFGAIYGLLSGVGAAAVVMRSHALKVVVSPFIEASRASGSRGWHVITSHIMPHMLPLAAVYMTVTVTGAVVADGFISFLGVTTPHHTWGTMIYMSFAFKQMLGTTPWNALIVPSIAFSLFAGSFYFVSRGLHRVANPHLQDR